MLAGGGRRGILGKHGSSRDRTDGKGDGKGKLTQHAMSPGFRFYFLPEVSGWVPPWAPPDLLSLGEPFTRNLPIRSSSWSADCVRISSSPSARKVGEPPGWIATYWLPI